MAAPNIGPYHWPDSPNTLELCMQASTSGKSNQTTPALVSSQVKSPGSKASPSPITELSSLLNEETHVLKLDLSSILSPALLEAYDTIGFEHYLRCIQRLNPHLVVTEPFLCEAHRRWNQTPAPIKIRYFREGAMLNWGLAQDIHRRIEEASWR